VLSSGGIIRIVVPDLNTTVREYLGERPFGVQSQLTKVFRKTLLILGVIAAIIAILGHTPTQGLGSWDRNTLAGMWIPLPVLRFPEFLVGMVLGNLFLRDRSVSRKTFLTTMAALGAVLLLSVPIGPWVSLVVLPFELLIYCLASSHDPLTALLSRPLFILLGGASYSLYLLQLPIRNCVRVLIPRISSNLAALSAPPTPLILILVSILVFRIWEEPMRRAIRRWLAPVF
jgi:peptidoglycan/LPS O-acetylase OafA/YrhL